MTPALLINRSRAAWLAENPSQKACTDSRLAKSSSATSTSADGDAARMLAVAAVPLSMARQFTVVFGLGGVLIAVGLVRTRQTRGSPKQEQFLAGRVPAPLPDGFYEGSADFDTRSWKGKTFSAVDGSGKNVFAGDDGTR